MGNSKQRLTGPPKTNLLAGIKGGVNRRPRPNGPQSTDIFGEVVLHRNGENLFQAVQMSNNMTHPPGNCGSKGQSVPFGSPKGKAHRALDIGVELWPCWTTGREHYVLTKMKHQENRRKAFCDHKTSLSLRSTRKGCTGESRKLRQPTNRGDS